MQNNSPESAAPTQRRSADTTCNTPLENNPSIYQRKAWRLVERILDVHHDITTRTNNNNSEMIAPLGIHEMAAIAERFFEAHTTHFHHNARVDCGVHYTKHENVANIQKYGLLSTKERDEKNVYAEFTGDNVGDGIYIGSDAFSFHGKFGDVGILTARLSGRWGTMKDRINGCGFLDTIIVRPGDAREFYVLQSSRQCLPLILFSANLIVKQCPTHPGNKLVELYHQKVQTVLDEFFGQQQQQPLGATLFDDFMI